GRARDGAKEMASRQSGVTGRAAADQEGTVGLADLVRQTRRVVDHLSGDAAHGGGLVVDLLEQEVRESCQLGGLVLGRWRAPAKRLGLHRIRVEDDHTFVAELNDLAIFWERDLV